MRKSKLNAKNMTPTLETEKKADKKIIDKKSYENRAFE